MADLKPNKPLAGRKPYCHWIYEDGLEPGATYPRHTHEAWELLLVKDGSMRVWTDGKEDRGVIGSIFIRPPGTPHQEWCTSKVRLRLQILFWHLPPQCPLHPPAQAFDTTGHIRHALLWLEHMWFLIGPGPHPILNATVEGIILDCLNAVPAVPANPFIALAEHIRQNLGEPHTISNLARRMSMSRTQFTREFRRHLGVSAMAFVRTARIKRACEMLRTGDPVLRAVAQETGFRDEFELSRVFRRVMGISPGSLRQATAPHFPIKKQR